VKTGGTIHYITEKNYKRHLLYKKPTNSGRHETTLVQAFTHSQLDYCNALLAAAADSQIKRLLSVQNTVARLERNLDTGNHYMPFLRGLQYNTILALIMCTQSTTMAESDMRMGFHRELPVSHYTFKIQNLHSLQWDFIQYHITFKSAIPVQK